MKVFRFVVILILFLGVLLITQLFADEDSLSFATYYPAPYGYYNEMQVQKMAVGTVNTTSVPTENGQLFVDRSVIFNPQADLNAIKNLPNPQIGELAYAASEDKFYYNNQGTSSSWVSQSASGGGICYTNYGGVDCATDYTAVLQGYVTMYLSYANSTPSASLACSSITHKTTFNGGLFLWGASTSERETPLADEPCAICCK